MFKSKTLKGSIDIKASYKTADMAFSYLEHYSSSIWSSSPNDDNVRVNALNVFFDCLRSCSKRNNEGGGGVAQPNLLFPLQPFLLFLSVSPLTLPHPKVNPSLSSAIVGSCLGCNRRQHGVSSPLSLTPCFVPECESSVRQLSVTN